jgi:hypothetical protein
MTPIAASIYFLPVRKFDKVYTHAVDAEAMHARMVDRVKSLHAN